MPAVAKPMWLLNAERSLKDKLKDSTYKFSTTKLMGHHNKDHIYELNFSNEWFCHTCRKAGIY